MTVQEKDRNKVVVLIVAIVLVFGFFLWRVVGVSTSEGAASRVVRLDEGQSTGASGGVGSTAVPTQVVEVVPPTNSQSTQPFRQVLPSPGTGQATTTTTAQQTPRPYNRGTGPIAARPAVESVSRGGR